MKTSRIGTHLLSVLLLLLWGGVMIYFHASGRLAKGEYVSKNGIFTTMVLVGGIGCVTLALFNLATMGAKEEDCCDHDHGHDHDHSTCGHDHSHAHAEDCGHDHSQKESCCGHDHGHDDHAHHHEHSQDDHADHAHGILEESGALGRIVAIMILVVPITYASINSPDGFKNVQTIANKGVYNQTYKTDAMAGKFDLNKADAPAAPVAKPAVQDTPPAAPLKAAGDSPPPAVAAVANNPPPAAQTKSLGSFTLKDLEAQVPKSKDGNFMLEVPEIYYTAGDKEVQGVLTGQSVETIAQVIPEKVNNEKGTRVRIFRMLIQCCAADARPYSVPVEFAEKAPQLKDMSWVKVVGKMGYRKEGDQTVPVIMATSMTAAAEPDNKMVY